MSQLFVRMLDGHTAIVDVDHKTTVRDVIRDVMRQKNYRGKYVLIFAGRSLDERMIIWGTEILKEGTVHFVKSYVNRPMSEQEMVLTEIYRMTELNKYPFEFKSTHFRTLAPLWDVLPEELKSAITTFTREGRRSYKIDTGEHPDGEMYWNYVLDSRIKLDILGEFFSETMFKDEFSEYSQKLQQDLLVTYNRKQASRDKVSMEQLKAMWNTGLFPKEDKSEMLHFSKKEQPQESKKYLAPRLSPVPHRRSALKPPVFRKTESKDISDPETETESEYSIAKILAIDHGGVLDGSYGLKGNPSIDFVWTLGDINQTLKGGPEIIKIIRTLIIDRGYIYVSHSMNLLEDQKNTYAKLRSQCKAHDIKCVEPEFVAVYDKKYTDTDSDTPIMKRGNLPSAYWGADNLSGKASLRRVIEAVLIRDYGFDMVDRKNSYIFDDAPSVETVGMNEGYNVFKITASKQLILALRLLAKREGIPGY